MIQIIRLTVNDYGGSVDIEIMPCASIQNAEEVILNELNKGFDGEWTSLNEAVEDLSNELVYASWDDAHKTVQWVDNGNGETYIISNINEKDSLGSWQKIAVLC